MKTLKLTFILLDFMLALALAFVPADQNLIDTVDDYNEPYEQFYETILTN